MFKKFIEEKFNLYILIFGLVSITLLIFLLALNIFSTAKIRSVEILGDNQMAEIVDQRIVLNFNRPMDKDSVSDAIKITPETDFYITWRANKATVVFKQNLLSDTQYEFKIDSNIAYDIFDEKLKNDFTYNFRTKKNTFYYIQKSTSITGNDKIVRSNVDFSEAVFVYEDKNIVQFDKNENYFAVSTLNEDKSNTLKIIDIKKNEVYNVDLGYSIVNKIVFSPVDDKIAFSTQKITVEEKGFLSYGIPELRIYDLKIKNLKTLDTSKSAGVVFEVIFSRSGQAILVSGFDSNYFLIDINNPDNFVAMGKHLTSGGFSRNDREAIFLDFDPNSINQNYFYIYSFQEENFDLSSYKNYILDPVFFNNSKNFLFSEFYKEIENTRGIFKIKSGNLEGNFKDILQDETRSLELPVISYDDRYIAIEAYTPQDLLNYEDYRKFYYQTKPGYSNIIIYDLLTNNKIDKGVRGINVVWEK